MSKLFEGIDYFYKYAGELKVPQKLLKEATDWVITCYCNDLSKYIQAKIEGNKQREANLDKMDSEIIEWDRLTIILEEMKYAETSHRKAILFDDLLKLLNETQPNSKKYGLGENNCKMLSNFNLMDLRAYPRVDTLSFEPSGIYYDKLSPSHQHGPAILISVDNKNDKYNVSIESKQGAFEDKFDLTKDEAIDMINEHYGYIIDTFALFQKFRNKYEVFSSKYLENLTMMYGLCKKLSSNFEGKYGKTIVLDKDDIPYELGDIEQRVNVFVIFINNKKEAQFIGKNYSGMWVVNNNKYIAKGKDLDLGTIYVYKNMEKQARFVNSEIDLKNEIDDLKTTTRHEVQHFVQSLIEQYSGKLGGLPKEKITDKFFSPYGVQKLPGPMQQEFIDEDDYYYRVSHKLRDIEFYTRLSDSIDNFNEYKRYIPLQLHRDFMLTWIDHISMKEFNDKAKKFIEKVLRTQRLWGKEGEYDLDPHVAEDVQIEFFKETELLSSINRGTYGLNSNNQFFISLKKHQPKKYMKACAEFSKAVNL